MARFSPIWMPITFVAPVTGADPTRGPVWPNVAEAAAIARSQATTSSLPPPAAAPFTAAITGRGHDLIASNMRSDARYSFRIPRVVGALSPASMPPAQNAPGAPVMTTDRTSLHESRASATASAICSSYAFRALGLSRVIQRDSPRS